MPHGHCYRWLPGILWLHILSDALIALAYFSIPFTLVYFIRKRKDLPFNWIFLCFAIFIVACGTTHLFEIFVIWHPVYWLQGVIKAITAAVSVPTAILLVRLIPQALSLPSQAALQREIVEREKTERKFKGLLEFAPDAIVIVNRQGELVLVNSQTEKLFGFPRAELIGKNIEVLIPERSRGDYFTAPQARPMGEGLEFEGLNKDGKKFPVEISSSPLETEEGTLAISAIRDITKRKQVEKELADQTEELRRSNHELEQYAYVTSHDMQEPLRAISSFAQILKQSAGPKLDQDETTLIGHVVDGAKRMSDIIQDLLSLSRIGSHGNAFKITAIEKPLAVALANLSVAIEERNAVIRPEALPTLPVDSLQLALMFQNLIGNAMKFCHDRVPEIVIGATRGGDGYWTVFVRDNGIGIEPRYFDRIFGVFQRLHTRTEYPGTGIGLAICKKIAERHGGRIWLESVKGRGTTFYFTLPETRKETVHGTATSD